ncbi:MAG: hypothetical protein ACE5Z5_02275 [Candidatus Bathyarchaeia archaeon]
MIKGAHKEFWLAIDVEDDGYGLIFSDLPDDEGEVVDWGMLVLVGLGLHDELGISLRGLEEAEAAYGAVTERIES